MLARSVAGLHSAYIVQGMINHAFTPWSQKYRKVSSFMVFLFQRREDSQCYI